MNKFGTALKKARKEKGLTQLQLAKLLEIEKAHISKLELGAKNCSDSYKEKIAEALGMELIILLKKKK